MKNEKQIELSFIEKLKELKFILLSGNMILHITKAQQSSFQKAIFLCWENTI